MPKEIEKKLTLSYTKEEIAQDIMDLRDDKDIALFLRVESGARKYNRLVELNNILEQKEEEKK